MTLKLNLFAFLDKLIPDHHPIDRVLDKLSDRYESNKPVSLKNGVLTFNKAGDYSFETMPNGKVKILFSDGATTVLTKQEWASITTFDLKNAGVNLTVEASVLDGKTYVFKGEGDLNVNGVHSTPAVGWSKTPVGQNVNLDGIDFGGTLETVNGSKADYFALMWDNLDEAYASGSYYNTPINEAFINLGIEYLEYLKGGGAPLTDFGVKAYENGPMDFRYQTLHDNLLGNFNKVDFDSRFPEGTVLRAELLAKIEATGFSDIFERGVYSGHVSAINGPAHTQVRAWDYDHGIDRPDFMIYDQGKVSSAASDDRNGDGVDEQMFYGTGNSNDHFVMVRHMGAGVELALKAKEFGPNGGDYTGFKMFSDGAWHYNVSAGASPDNANRADWSFDYAATVLPHGTDDAFTFKLKVDVDASEGVNLAEIPVGTANGLVQGSSNIGFNFIKSQIDSDPSLDGIQPYDFGEGQFDIVLEAYADTGTLLAQNRIVVHVSDAII